MKPTPPPRLGQRPSLAQALSQANNQGLTLIECLVAIIMVALVASAITPALILSVATRVQSQKAEQAMALGQSEIDRVRQLVEQGALAQVDAQVPQAPNSVLDSAPETQVGAAVGTTNIKATPTSPTHTRAIDVNGDGVIDFAVQIYRTRGITDAAGEPVAFALGVRVYDYDAVASGTSGNLSTEPLSLGITGGTGKRSERPIAAFYTTIAAAERGNSLCDLIRYSQSTTGVVSSSPLGCGP
ncbi:MAG: type II secretion system protein [Spirulina sp.]